MTKTNPLLLPISNGDQPNPSIEQFHLLDQLNKIAKWVSDYDKDHRIQTQEEPVAFSIEGYCLGLSRLALTSSAISHTIARKASANPRPDANTIENFYEMLRSISTAQIPQDVKAEKINVFYTKMSAIIQCIEGAHRGGFPYWGHFKTSNDSASIWVDYSQYKDFYYPSTFNTAEFMNYIAPKGYEFILQNSYSFNVRPQEQLLHLLKHAQSGDMFNITLTPHTHAVAIYCLEDRIELYNPNCDSAQSIAIDQLDENAFKDGGVFHSLTMRHTKGRVDQDVQYTSITCEHIVTSDLFCDRHLSGDLEDEVINADPALSSDEVIKLICENIRLQSSTAEPEITSIFDAAIKFYKGYYDACASWFKQNVTDDIVGLVEDMACHAIRTKEFDGLKKLLESVPIKEFTAQEGQSENLMRAIRGDKADACKAIDVIVSTRHYGRISNIIKALDMQSPNDIALFEYINSQLNPPAADVPPIGLPPQESNS